MTPAVQPVHVVYGGGHLFRHDIANKLGGIAMRAFELHKNRLAVPDAILDRVEAKLRREPVEDYRIDFEDGYGLRSGAEEQQHVWKAASEIGEGYRQGTLPPRLGVRFRHSASEAVGSFCEIMLRETGGVLPANFAVTLPKLRTPEEVRAALPYIPEGVAVELMIETPEALSRCRELVQAAEGRCRGAHFGPYDFTSACGIAGHVQSLGHPLCDYARARMLVELAPTGVWLVDGPTSLLPVGSPEEVERGWILQMSNIQRAMESGFYQGWDVHPAQLPARFAAVFRFFQDAAPECERRLRNFIDQQAQATRVGAAFDDAATAEGLRNFFHRAVSCGAMDPSTKGVS